MKSKPTSLPHLFREVAQGPDNPTCLNHRVDDRWQATSTREVATAVEKLALGLAHLGLKPGNAVGIMAQSSPQWIIADLAIMAAGGVTVPLFFDMSPENLTFEIADAGIDLLFVSDPERLEVVAEAVAGLDKIILLHGEASGRQQITYNRVLVFGSERQSVEPGLFNKLIERIQSSDLATLVYTSGSTGAPKGAEITQANLVTQLQASSAAFPLAGAKEKVMSCLPLAHIYERNVMYCYLYTGASVYFVDDIKALAKLMQDVRPSMIAVVPRLLEKMHARMHTQMRAKTGLAGLVAKMAFLYAEKHDPQRFAMPLVHAIFHRLVYTKLLAALGGRLKYVILGGAPVAADILQFFVMIGVPIYQGYGMTESTSVVCVNTPDANSLGTVGKPLAHSAITISEENDEVLIRGGTVMRAYHNNEAATREAIDADGWLHTGDLGSVNSRGYLTIKGRAKELFKTSNGKYVRPVPIEQALGQGDLVDMAVVIAENRRFVSCLIVLDRHEAGKLDSAVVSERIQAWIDSVNTHLSHWEQVRKFRVLPEPVSIQGGELTPTMKLRRHVIEEKYRDLIEEMYREVK